MDISIHHFHFVPLHWDPTIIIMVRHRWHSIATLLLVALLKVSAYAFSRRRPAAATWHKSYYDHQFLVTQQTLPRKQVFSSRLSTPFSNMKLHGEGKNHDSGKDDMMRNPSHQWNRRRLVHSIVTSLTTSGIISGQYPLKYSETDNNNNMAYALGLLQFPCTKPLSNIYHFIRAGTSLLEEQDIWSTNPLFLTNREAALSPRGVSQIQEVEVAQQLSTYQIYPSVVKYSFAANAYDTATILQQELRIGQNRMVPEFFFLDPRAIGKWDMFTLSTTEPAVFAMDYDEAGEDGTGGRPPPNDDGTPHETLADQAVRLRQLLSGTYSFLVYFGGVLRTLSVDTSN